MGKFTLEPTTAQHGPYGVLCTVCIDIKGLRMAPQVRLGSEYGIDNIGSYCLYCKASNGFGQKWLLCTTDLLHATDLFWRAGCHFTAGLAILLATLDARPCLSVRPLSGHYLEGGHGRTRAAENDDRHSSGRVAALKRLASAVRFRPWPPCFQQLTDTPFRVLVPIGSNNQLGSQRFISKQNTARVDVGTDGIGAGQFFFRFLSPRRPQQYLVPMNSRNSRCPALNDPTLSVPVVSIPIRARDGGCATGETIRFPFPSNPMKPRSNRWSMVGGRRTPFSPLRRSAGGVTGFTKALNRILAFALDRPDKSEAEAGKER